MLRSQSNRGARKMKSTDVLLNREMNEAQIVQNFPVERRMIVSALQAAYCLSIQVCMLVLLPQLAHSEVFKYSINVEFA